uniref:Uncharacterized protein n=1 Tax=Oryzias sinensis TaxID=183150 RepID=A0A8C7XNZ6_9TELE
MLTCLNINELCSKAGGVHFSEEPPSTGVPSHVHFDEKLHDSVVMVTQEDDGNFMVKVCSFQHFSHTATTHNESLRLLYASVQSTKEGGEYSVASLRNRHHGTPMLLEGVRCIGVELEYDSEHSDWQGFD